MPDELYEQVVEQAHQNGDNVSALIAETMGKALRRQALIDWAYEIAEQTGGPYTDEERAWARKQLGLSSTPGH